MLSASATMRCASCTCTEGVQEMANNAQKQTTNMWDKHFKAPQIAIKPIRKGTQKFQYMQIM